MTYANEDNFGMNGMVRLRESDKQNMEEVNKIGQLARSDAVQSSCRKGDPDKLRNK